jgi:hypothetical protein
MCALQSCCVCCVQFPNLLGQALPTSSKFFFTYLIMRTLMSVPLRFLIAQPGVWQCWLRCGTLRPKQDMHAVGISCTCLCAARDRDERGVADGL